MKEQREIIVYAIMCISICLILLISFRCKSQIVITPSAQVSIYDQSIGLMAGYKYNKITTALNYQRGHQYQEKSLYLKYDFTNTDAFNVGLSVRTGWVNNYFKVFYPALEQEFIFNKWSIQLGLRPTEKGLLILEPRVQFKINGRSSKRK